VKRIKNRRRIVTSWVGGCTPALLTLNPDISKMRISPEHHRKFAIELFIYAVA